MTVATGSCLVGRGGPSGTDGVGDMGTKRDADRDAEADVEMDGEDEGDMDGEGESHRSMRALLNTPMHAEALVSGDHVELTV